MKRISLLLLMLFAGPALAAKISVQFTTPTTNTDGSALTNLSHVIVEWGTCVGTAFGVKQSSITIPVTAIGQTRSTPAYPTGLTRVCIRAFAFNTLGTSSNPSNVAVKDLLPKPGKPVTLQQPVILSFNKR